MRNDEIHQLLALKISFPEVVPLSLGDLQLHLTAECTIVAGKFPGIVAQRHEGVAIAVDVKDRHAGLRQRLQSIDGVVFAQLGFELHGRQAVGAAGPLQAGKAADVAYRVDPGNARDRLWVLAGPVVEHQSAAAARSRHAFSAKPRRVTSSL